ncbi:terminase gpA endonuclease subunit [Methylorubrum populi]|nr:terminase gpA endonuclease subunit [Methylorubrum populi]
MQKDRLEVSVWGFGRNRERWLVEHRVIPPTRCAIVTSSSFSARM